VHHLMGVKHRPVRVRRDADVDKHPARRRRRPGIRTYVALMRAACPTCRNAGHVMVVVHAVSLLEELAGSATVTQVCDTCHGETWMEPGVTAF
jgi:hypothetical protein